MIEAGSGMLNCLRVIFFNALNYNAKISCGIVYKFGIVSFLK